MGTLLNRVTAIAGVAVILAGCTGVRHTPVGPTCISCKPYYCRGSWHYPQLYYEYNEVGIASWYGDDCHGKSKATGEPFDKMAMTAAHKTLPLPSVARVTSLITGKSIVVVIDDRGPYVYKGRIIDLSYGAAVALGIHGRKPSMVRVEVLVEDSLKLSRYAALCRRNKGIRRGRSLCQVYFEDVKGMPMPIPPIYTASHTQRLERKRSGISTRQQHPSSKRNSHSGPRKSLQAHIDHIRA